KVLTFDLNTTFNPNDNSTAASTERFIGSKGYYPDRVEIKWSTANNLNLIEYFKVFRRQLGFNENYTQIASVTSSSQIYIDETTNAGTLYEYLIIGEAQCLTETVFTDSLVGIGFRSPTAIVNGQVNYSGGVAVENVKVLFETTTQSGKSIKLDGSSYLKVKNGFADSQNHNEFYLENWIYPINDSVFTIFEHGNFVFKYNNNQFEFSQNGIDSIFSAGQLSVGQWQHVGLALKDGLLYLFLNGEGQSYIKAPNSFLLSSSDSIKVGQGLIGNVEEIRFWESVAVDTNHIIDTIVTVNTNTNDTTFENSIKIVAPQITRDFSRYINGSETGLVTYLRLDEYAGRYSYDLSYSGLAYNRNNAEFVGSVTRENEKPTASQLSYAAYTNELGSYTATIPYTGVGQNFTVTPSYKTHEFNPATTALFLGDGSSVNNGVNFEDKSSFPVTGTLFYESTTCAVKEANILVDGESVVVNGHPVRTDVNGHFSVQVPIGHHIIEVSKQGHVFKEGRFPSSGTFDFQEPVNGIEFEDSTKVKVVGRVVGGLRDIAKLPNLGRGKNNIGVAEIVFKSQQGNGCVNDTIYTDSNTGEYVAYLPPLKYIPTVNISSNPDIQAAFNTLDLLDFGVYQPITNISDTTTNPIDSSLIISETSYHFLQDYVYRTDPTISVTNTDGITDFSGEKTYTYKSVITGTDTTINLEDYPMKWPVFIMGEGMNVYKGEIRIFEEYYNYDSGNPKLDSVPTTDGKVSVLSGFSKGGVNSVELNDVNDSDTLRTLIFDMPITASPNFVANTSVPDYSYTRTLEIDVVMNSGKSIKWNPVTNPSTQAKEPFRGYLLGKVSVGNQFVTNGPQVVDFILRDPPGSDSYSEREIGSTTTANDSWNYSTSNSGESEMKISAGSKFSTGVGVQVETEISVDLTVGLTSEISLERSGAVSTTTTTNNVWSTDANSDQAGSGSDLFVGTAKNVEFGIRKELLLIPISDTSRFTTYSGTNTNGFVLGEKHGISIAPGGYETQFIYSQNHIKNYLIPELIQKRNALLESDPQYVSNLSKSDPNYGKNNDNPVFGTQRSTNSQFTRETSYLDNTGLSYTYTPTSKKDSLKDVVWSDNHQIDLWEKVLWQNEWEKAVIDDDDILDSLKTAELNALDKEYALTIAAYGALTVGEIAAASYTHRASLSGSTGAIRGAIGFAVTRITGVATAELTNKFNEYLHRRDDINDLFDRSKVNYSISAGSTFSESMSHERAISNETAVNYDMSVSLELETKVKVNGTGPEDKFKTGFNFKRGRAFSRESSSSEVTNFTIADGDQGDYFSVDVYPSILGNGPIFKLKDGGRTSCPFEDAIYTEYYKPNGNAVQISGKTLQRDKPTIDISPSIVQNVPLEESAVFNLELKNESESNDAREYNYQLVTNSNPFGA
ncbi:MAG: hypothetical protein ACPG6V_12860, partial [Flavobacteriales bacterium]